MSTIHLHQTTTLTPEQYIAGLTDFGPGRSKLFGNSADDYLKVHSLGTTQADVTEGSGGIWERLHYDWSDPNHVVLTTADSNTVGKRVQPHLHLHTPSRWFDGHRRGGGTRRQEPQGMVSRLGARDRGQGRFGEGVCKLSQSHRSPERGRESGRLSISGVGRLLYTLPSGRIQL